MNRTNKLTAVAVSKITKPGRYGDGGGLWLQVSKWGTKAWLFRYMMDGRARSMGLGSVDTFSLKEARERARECRQMLADGIDPIEARLAERDARRAQEADRITFKEAARKYIALHETQWKNDKHKAQWASSLRTYAFPTLGDRPVSAVDGALITDALEPIWRTKAETATRVKQRIERVIQWVKDGMPLPAPPKAKRVKHHKAIPWEDMPRFMERLRSTDSVSARALEFTILSAVRTGDVIGATWDEVDLEKALWTIPSARTKAGRPHRVPLPERAVEILKGMTREKGNPYIFPGGRAGKGLSNMAMLQLVRGMEGNGFTVHGFRSAFKDWAAESTAYPNIVSEAALAHVVSDKTEAAYRRGDLFAKRTRLMRDWAKYLEKPVKARGNVVAMGAA